MVETILTQVGSLIDIIISKSSISIIAGIIGVFIYQLLKHSYYRYKKHWRVRKARVALDRFRKHFRQDSEFPKMISYLRKVDPYLFESMILHSLSDYGIKVKHNIKVSGDGGIDGRFWYKRKLYFVQAKRYKNHIKKQHVDDFIKICKKAKAKGVFCHTGKTGAGTKELMENNIGNWSGSFLTDLLRARNKEELLSRLV